EEIYRWIFENSVPGLPEAARREGLTPLAYMRKYGAFLVEDNVYRTYESPAEHGVVVDGAARVGFPTPSRKLEFFSKTLKDWKWPEHAVPGYIRSHVHWSQVDQARGEMVLLPTFRLPTPRASGGRTPACTRTSRFPCSRIPSAASTAGTRR